MREAMLDAWRQHASPELGRLIRSEPAAPELAELAEAVSVHGSVFGLTPLLQRLKGHVNDPRLTPLLLEVARLPLDSAPVTRRELLELWRRNSDPEGAEQMKALGAEPLRYEPLPEHAAGLI